jgi:MFS family permease
MTTDTATAMDIGAPAKSSPGSLVYEFWVVLLLGLAYGFAFYDRQMMSFLSPFVIPEFHLNNTEVGALGAALSLTWAIGAYVFGRWSDQKGVRKPFLLAAMFIFSACSVLSGLATGFWTLLGSRMLMGLVEGPFLPICLAIVAATAPASRRGLNSGMVQNLFGSVLGMTVAPLVSIRLASAFGWRVSFFTGALPGLVLALLVWLTIREPARPAQAAGAREEETADETLGLLYMLRQRNIALCCVIGCLAVGALLVVTIFLPVYLTQVRHYDANTMSNTVAWLGFTAPIGGVLVPGLSDRFGRRPLMIVFTGLMALTPLTVLLFHGSELMLLILLFTGWLGVGSLPLFMAVVPSETLNFRSTAAAMGLVVGMGEIFGGVIAPPVAGSIADAFGLQWPFIIAAAMALLAALVSTALVETNPAIVAKTRPATA